MPAEQIRLAPSLENLSGDAEEVDFVIIAGDVYDGDWQDYSTGLFLNANMAKLRDNNIPVYLIRGNHDAASTITKRLALPDNVYEFPVDRPETKVIDNLRVAIHGQSYEKRDVWDNLALQYPEPVPGHFNIGILHTSLEGQEGHEPLMHSRVEEFAKYQYWALISTKRQVIGKTRIFFPGNIQERHIRETGDKGCTLVTVDGTDVKVEHKKPRCPSLVFMHNRFVRYRICG